MKITEISTHAVGAGWKNWLFVQVQTDEGLTGSGEATLNGFSRATEAAVHDLAPLVIGLDPRQVRKVAATLLERVSMDAGHVHRHAIAGIEVACWDILGKSLAVPIYSLLGGQVRDAVDAYGNGWYRAERSPGGFAEAARAAIEKGFRALKFDPLGTARGFFESGELGATREIIAAVREAVGPRVKLMIDMHARLAPSEAVRLIETCGDLGIFWWEEPTTREREEPTSAVARRTTGTIACGEIFDTVGQFLTLVKDGGVAILQPEPMSLGGLSPTLAVAEIGAADGLWIAPHQSDGPVALAACLQLAATVPNFLIQEHFGPFNEPWTAELVSWTPRLDPETGRLDLPSAPGLGLELNLDVVRAHPYDPGAFLDLTAPGWERRRSISRAGMP